MSDINIPFSEEEIEETRDAVELINAMIQSAKTIVNDPDSYTKEELVEIVSPLLDIIELMVLGGQQVIEASVEIHHMTQDPSSDL